MKKNRWKGHCYLCTGEFKDKRAPRRSTPPKVMRALGQVRRFNSKRDQENE